MTAIHLGEPGITDAVARRFDASIDATTAFFATHVDAISNTCLEMARRFERGGRLIAFGAGAAASDAQHVSVEFIHPVIVGKRALPAIPLTGEAGGFASMIAALSRPDDIALAIGGDTSHRDVTDAIASARAKGLLTITVGAMVDDEPKAHSYRVPRSDALVAQEVSETFYHVLWELVHLFLEHSPATAGK